MTYVKSLTQRASLPLVLMHVVLIVTLTVNMVMTLPVLGN